MPRFLYAFLALFIIIPHQASAVKMGIVTGSKKGTYYQIGSDISKLVASRGINLKVYSADGSLDNINAIYEQPDVQLGIAQSDALLYVDAMVDKDDRMKQVAKKIKMVFPLYNEEVHILAKKQISTFSDLTGKKVAIGKKGSGSYLTANMLFHLAQFEPAVKRADLSETEAIQALRDGEIDAMFYVAGYPVKLFQEMPSNGNLHLVPITHQKIIGFYPVAIIPSSAYNWQTKNVSTIAVKAVLITYNYNCENVGFLARVVYEKLDFLKHHGHHKWKTVDFDDFKFDSQSRIWEQSVCVKRQIRQGSPEKQRWIQYE